MNLNKTLNLLTICQKAGKLTGGFDKSCAQIKDGKAACILLSSDISEKTEKEIRFLCEKYSVDVYNSDFSAEQVYKSLGKKYAVFSVNDLGFAKKFAEYAQN